MIKKYTKSKNKHRVVVTGLGVVSSLGIGWQEFWKNLIAGKSGISKITSFDTSQYERHYGGEVKNFDPTKFMSKRKASQMGRASQMAVAASKLALKDAGLKKSDLGNFRAGICLGTTMGEPQIMEMVDKKSFINGRCCIDCVSALTYPSNSIVSNVEMQLGLNFKSYMFANACAAGNYAIAKAFDLIKKGETNIMFAGGADSISRIAFTGFSRLFNMAPEKCRPFDQNRKGMILGEGAGIIVVESLENAQRRNAKIYAEILGYGLSCSATHMTIPGTDGVRKAIAESLKSSGIKSSQVDYINAHGTGTKENDSVECAAFYKVFGKNLRDIPVSSIKSMLGHAMGAGSAIEAISCCLAINRNEIPPTINYNKSDPNCDIDCVPNNGRKCSVNVTSNNSTAFGGNNACLVLCQLR